MNHFLKLNIYIYILIYIPCRCLETVTARVLNTSHPPHCLDLAWKWNKPMVWKWKEDERGVVEHLPIVVWKYKKCEQRRVQNPPCYLEKDCKTQQGGILNPVGLKWPPMHFLEPSHFLSFVAPLQSLLCHCSKQETRGCIGRESPSISCFNQWRGGCKRPLLLRLLENKEKFMK